MKLRDVQTHFKDSIFDESLPEVFAANFSTDGKKIALADRLSVYRHTVVGGLTDVIVATFPMLHKLVGDDFLRQAANLYVRGNPPTKSCLNFYGTTFPDFIAAYEPAKKLSYLADIARLEWAWEEAQHAVDDASLLAESLAKIPQDQLPTLTLPLRDSVRLMKSTYPLHKIVDFCRLDGEGQPPDVSATQPYFFMIFRPMLQVQLRKIDAGEFAFLSALSEGKTILEAVEIAFESLPSFDLTVTLQRYLSLDVFSC
jgi:hypothetical protein